MRIARVLLAGSPAEPASPTPIVALERDGALYAVAELDRRFGTRFSPDRFANAGDFHTRVLALGCAGLDELDDRLLAGSRPTEARLLPGTFLWLAPAATERCAYVHASPPESPDAEPRCRFGNARGLGGHDAAIPFPAREGEPGLELCLAAVLADDLSRATAGEARRAVLGYAVLDDWTARQQERRDRERGAGQARARDFATQLGPVLVTAAELGDPARLRAEVRVGDAAPEPCGTVGAHAAALLESIAFVSEQVELMAGDVVAVGPLASRPVAYGTHVEVWIERLGRLAGRAVRGPEPVGWRSDRR